MSYINEYSIKEGVMTSDNKWAVFFTDVDFITWKQNWDTHEYILKLHIDTKQLKLNDLDEAKVLEIIEEWKKARGE